MKEALVIGGSNGIGLAITLELQKRGCHVHVIDKTPNELFDNTETIIFQQVNLLTTDFSFLENYKNIDTLVITAGFGRIAPFEDILEQEIQNSFRVNSISVMKVLHHFFPRMKQHEPFHCAVM